MDDEERLACIRSFEDDHGPDGWPAIQMKEITWLLDMIARLQARIKELEATHDWYCGCGHWNGPNLSVCALCGRTPSEGRG